MASTSPRPKPELNPENREEFISIIYDESNRLQKLVEDVLDLRKLGIRGDGL